MHLWLVGMYYLHQAGLRLSEISGVLVGYGHVPTRLACASFYTQLKLYLTLPLNSPVTRLAGGSARHGFTHFYTRTGFSHHCLRGFCCMTLTHPLASQLAREMVY